MLLRTLIFALLLWGGAIAELPSVADYPSIQTAIDANPGTMVHVPPGEYRIDTAIRIGGSGGGLYGFATIIQSNPAASILEIYQGKDLRLNSLTLKRSGEGVATEPGIMCRESENIDLEGLEVVSHHGRAAAIEIRSCKNSTVRDCLIQDYKAVTVDDRTQSPLHGYSFRCIDGTGIIVNVSTGTRLLDNRILESRLWPTRAMKDEHKLGEMLVRPEKQTRLIPPDAWESGYVNNWHQGSGIVVTGPRDTRGTVIRGNVIEHAAQGIDLHSDEVLCVDNVVRYGMMGVKMTHGCSNVIVKGNLLSYIDLWGILVNPGSSSNYARVDGDTVKENNHDSGIMIVDNMISHYGYGDEYWNWGGQHKDGGGSYAIALLGPQLPEENPPLSDILIQGNMVYDSGRTGKIKDGAVVVEPPRYRYAIRVEGTPGSDTFPKNLIIRDNLFHPGKDGICNLPELIDRNPE